MDVDIEMVRPRKLAISDKYSANLYRYIRKWREWGIGAYVSDRNLVGEPEHFNFDDPKAGRIVIGRKDEDGWLGGSRLGEILRKANCERWAFVPRDAAHYHDVTDWFWPEYIRIGRALWDAPGTASMIGDEDRWETIDKNTRKCRWSGRIYTSHVETINRKPIKRTIWTRVDSDNVEISEAA